MVGSEPFSSSTSLGFLCSVLGARCSVFCIRYSVFSFQFSVFCLRFLFSDFCISAFLHFCICFCFWFWFLFGLVCFVLFCLCIVYFVFCYLLFVLNLIMEEIPSDEFPEQIQLPSRWWWSGSSWHFCYGEGRYWWIYAPRVTLVSRSRLAGVTGFLRPPAHADPIGTVLIFGGRRLRRKGGLFVRVLLSYMAIYHGYGIRDLTWVTKGDRSTVHGVAWVGEES